ncbi:hypothetical protein [Caulobacter sp. D5]|uniref:hypothetical protein n=1 Tax=Caulobacter sp. D5 TaxID=357400 RepID=UPI001E41FDC8|nr:hypothetical protein [Caulobacter sp. D5]
MTTFETAALDALLKGDDPVLAILRQQAVMASVLNREVTGVGVLTNVVISEGSPLLQEPLSFKLGDVFGEAAELDDGFGLLLHVSNGRIETLEAYAFGDTWQAEPERAFFHYQEPSGRNMDKVRETIRQARRGS